MAGALAKNCNPMADAKHLGVSEHVEFVGWITSDKLPSYIAASKLCTHTPPVIREETDKTVATKVYQYIVMHKPLIVGAAKRTRDLVLENNIGFAIKNGDAKDFAEKVESLYNNQELMTEFSNNAKQVSEQIAWENTVQSLINAYHNLATEN